MLFTMRTGLAAVNGLLSAGVYKKGMTEIAGVDNVAVSLRGL